MFYVHHTGKANARDKTEDQYSGRGGSALSDGSRMVFVMNRLEPDDWTKQTGRPLEAGEVGLKISVAKLSYCEPQAPIYVVRKGYNFAHIIASIQTDDERERNDAEARVRAFIVREAAKRNIPHSRKTLEDEELGLPRAESCVVGDQTA